MKVTYEQFQVFLHILVAFVYLAEVLKPHLPTKVYKFLITNRDTLMGCYYVYLAYEIYLNKQVSN